MDSVVGSEATVKVRELDVSCGTKVNLRVVERRW